MKLTEEWLKENNACYVGILWFKNQEESDGIKVVLKLLSEDKFSWANWLLVRLMTHIQKVQYAVFAAEQVIDIYEKKYPEDKRPRLAIEAAKAFIKDPSDTNKNAAANAVAYAADAANAAYAADAAAYTAAYAANAANAAANAATYAVAYAANAANAADAAAYVAAIKKQIIDYGIGLL